MKLTTEQITIIEKKLVLNNLKFDDLKLELTDHIASDIEELMDINMLSFEENLKLVFSKWSFQFKPSSSFWVGIIYSAPKIVMDKWVLNTKKTFLFSVIGSLIVSSILSFLISFFKIENVFGFIMDGIKCLFILFFTLYLAGFLLILKSKFSTVFSYIYKRTWYLFLFHPFGYGLDNLFYHYNYQVFWSSFFPILILVMIILYLKLAYKHFQFEKKLTIYNS